MRNNVDVLTTKKSLMFDCLRIENVEKKKEKDRRDSAHTSKTEERKHCASNEREMGTETAQQPV